VHSDYNVPGDDYNIANGCATELAAMNLDIGDDIRSNSAAKAACQTACENDSTCVHIVFHQWGTTFKSGGTISNTGYVGYLTHSLQGRTPSNSAGEDPIMTDLDGTQFSVHGKANATFNLISIVSFSVNALFS